MSRFSSLRSRAYLGIILPSLAAPLFAGCDAPAYVMGSEDDAAIPSGDATAVNNGPSLGSGGGGMSSAKNVGSSTWASSNANGGKTSALTGTVSADSGATSGGARGTTTGLPEQNDGQGGTEATSLTSLERSIGAGGIEGSGGGRAAGGSTPMAQSSANAGGVTANGGSQGVGGTSGPGGANTSSTSALNSIGGLRSIGGATSNGGAIATGGRNGTGGAVVTGGTLSAVETNGGTPSSGGAVATGGIVSTGGSRATGGSASSGGSSSASSYCSTYVDLGTRGSTSTEYKAIPAAATCYRFAVTAVNEVFRGIQMSNCDTRTVSINGANPGCAPSTNCSVATYIARASDGYFYVNFSAGSSTNCTSTWWWSP
ncbi:MAG: hypothetical protein ACM3ZE_18150 [Myxococcales bacterium]